MNAYDREIQQLEDDLRDGLITQAEFNKAIREVQMYAREAAEEAAENAYNHAMWNW